MEMKFYKCAHCGKIIAVVKETGVPVMCCGQKMAEIVPDSTDAATEKHVPVYTVNGSTVKVSVGSVAHPMTEEHYIEAFKDYISTLQCCKEGGCDCR